MCRVGSVADRPHPFRSCSGRPQGPTPTDTLALSKFLYSEEQVADLVITLSLHSSHRPESVDRW
jgi:hypothetical protein